jgi:hypothetical protein
MELLAGSRAILFSQLTGLVVRDIYVNSQFRDGFFGIQG